VIKTRAARPGRLPRRRAAIPWLALAACLAACAPSAYQPPPDAASTALVTPPLVPLSQILPPAGTTAPAVTDTQSDLAASAQTLTARARSLGTAAGSDGTDTLAQRRAELDQRAAALRDRVD